MAHLRAFGNLAENVARFLSRGRDRWTSAVKDSRNGTYTGDRLARDLVDAAVDTSELWMGGITNIGAPTPPLAYIEGTAGTLQSPGVKTEVVVEKEVVNLSAIKATPLWPSAGVGTPSPIVGSRVLLKVVDSERARLQVTVKTTPDLLVAGLMYQGLLLDGGAPVAVLIVNVT